MKKLPVIAITLESLIALLTFASQNRPRSPLDEWHVDIGQRAGRPLRLAVADFEPGNGGARGAASELAEVLRNDLEFASVFLRRRTDRP